MTAPITAAISQDLPVLRVLGVFNPAGFATVRAGRCGVKRASAHAVWLLIGVPGQPAVRAYSGRVDLVVSRRVICSAGSQHVF